MSLSALSLRKRSTLIAAVLVMLAVVMAACEPRAQQVVVLPTVMVLPSLTPSDTPTNTPPFTRTPLPTDTPIFTNTPTETPVPPTSTETPTTTFTPSITPLPSATPTFTLTFTPTITPTFTPSVTPLPSETPIPSATSVAPIINSFTVSNTNVAPNSNVTLNWSADAESVRIEVLNQGGTILQTLPLATSGSINVAIPGGQGPLIIFRLVATRGGAERTLSLPVTVTCGIGWFFGDQYAPAGAACPQGNGASGDGRFQPFEGGSMIYVEANGLNTVFILRNSDATYRSFENDWDGEIIDGDNPDDLEDPQNVFNWAFYNTNPPGSSDDWEPIIGWATDDDSSGTRTIQYEQGTGVFYIDSPLGVFRFSGGDEGTWVRIRGPL